MYTGMDEQQQSRLFAELELREVEETGRELGSGAYGVVTEVKVKGLKYVQRRMCFLIRYLVLKSEERTEIGKQLREHVKYHGRGEISIW